MKIFLILFSLIIYCCCQVSLADIVVIGNKESQVKELTKKQVIDIYMGRKSTFPNGDTALPLDQNSDSTIRKMFYQVLVEKTVSEVNSYWARLLFSGRATPPRSIKGGTMVIDMIRNNKSAIGYIKLEDLTEDVRVLSHVD